MDLRARVKIAEGLAEYLDACGRRSRPPRRDPAHATDAPEVVDTAMRYSLLAGGKRLRPILCLASADAVGGGRNMALPAACAIELIHTYSLIHDDLPAMDNDTMRRGRPTLHVVAGEGMAILAGDGLLTEALHILARQPVSADARVAARKLRVIEIVAHAAGVVGMVGGQAIDLASVSPDPSGQRLPARRRRAARDARPQTGALIRASAVSGAIMGGGSRGSGGGHRPRCRRVRPGVSDRRRYSRRRG